jgi:succinyl-CoA synthetase alpha subunit
MPGMSFGHAGTVVEKRVDSPVDKIRRMREAGISVAEEIGDIPRLEP